MLQAKADRGSSFIQQGIITAKNEFKQGYRWILGDGNSIRCTSDPWILEKDDFRADQSRVYVDNTMVVAQLFKQNERRRDVDKVQNAFSGEDASIILVASISTIPVVDRVAWSRTTNGKYLVKTGYQL